MHCGNRTPALNPTAGQPPEPFATRAQEESCPVTPGNMEVQEKLSFGLGDPAERGSDTGLGLELRRGVLGREPQLPFPALGAERTSSAPEERQL